MDVNNDFWKFVSDNAKVSPEALRLKYHGKTADFDIDLAITQIECRRKFAVKLAKTLQLIPEFIFPTVLAGEQSTSDLLASYHATLIANGSKVADLTAGLGVDSFHIAQKADVTAVEIEHNRAQALAYNASHLPNGRIDVVEGDCVEFIDQCKSHFDAVFIDPARRADDGGRLYSLDDCKPPVLKLMPAISNISHKLIIKMSPMLDMSKVLKDIPETEKLIAVGTATECKELVAVVSFDKDVSNGAMQPVLEAVTLSDASAATLSFTLKEEQDAECRFATEKNLSGYKYLYEPYPAVMKVGAFNIISQRYSIDKIAANTNLYVSVTVSDGFAGDTLEIIEIITFESKHIKRLKKKYPKLMITTRNFDMPAEKLRAKLGVADGGELRLFAVTTYSGQKLMIVTKSLADKP